MLTQLVIFEDICGVNNKIYKHKVAEAFYYEHCTSLPVLFYSDSE